MEPILAPPGSFLGSPLPSGANGTPRSHSRRSDLLSLDGCFQRKATVCAEKLAGGCSALWKASHKAEKRTLNTLIKLVTFARETALARNPFAFFLITSLAPLAVFRDAPYLPHLNAAV